jgi:hypothetical protein
MYTEPASCALRDSLRPRWRSEAGHEAKGRAQRSSIKVVLKRPGSRVVRSSNAAGPSPSPFVEGQAREGALRPLLALAWAVP